MPRETYGKLMVLFIWPCGISAVSDATRVSWPFSATSHLLAKRNSSKSGCHPQEVSRFLCH